MTLNLDAKETAQRTRVQRKKKFSGPHLTPARESGRMAKDPESGEDRN